MMRKVVSLEGPTSAETEARLALVVRLSTLTVGTPTKGWMPASLLPARTFNRRYQPEPVDGPAALSLARITQRVGLPL